MRKRHFIIGGLLIILSFLLVSAASADTTYTVQPGDTLTAIARRFNTTVPAIVAANPQITNPNLIYVGDVLIIPGEGGTPPPPPPPPPPSAGTYTVQAGDTLTAIAQRFNTTVNTLLQLNPQITNPNLIYIGQTINLPGGTGGDPPPPPPTSGLEVGGQTQTLAHAQRMSEIGMKWVKLQYKWQAGDDPSAVAALVQQGHANNFNVLVSITGATAYPAPNSINFTAYTNFVRGVAALGQDAPEAIEIWNEQNIDFEWPAGQISPASYVSNMLAPAYNAIKSTNSEIMVISGAPAPTGFDNGHNAWADDRYIRGMVAAGATSYMDCIGVHHNAGATSPSVVTGHPGGNHYSWYFLPMVTLYSSIFGSSRPLCFTEIGYLSPEGYPGLPPNFSWAGETSVSDQASWLAEVVTLSMNPARRIRLLIIYNVDFTTYDPVGDPQAGYAIFRPDGSCPGCDTLSTVIPRG